MPATARPALNPRKTPVQARSAVTVDAILQATIQVLLAVGKERLTTTQVAQRAGVSIGTLYQYFPNKSALLQACLKRHMEEVTRAVERVAKDFRSRGLLEMSTALCHAYLNAKMRDVKASVTLYSVSSDIDGAAIVKVTTARCRRALIELFASAREGLTKDPDIVTSVVMASLNGISRRLLESRSPDRLLEPMRAELIVLVHAYLRTCTASPLADE